MGGDYTLHTKTLHFDTADSERTVNTPFAAQPLDRWTEDDIPLDSVRGFNEIYRQVPTDYFDSERDLENEIERTVEKAAPNSVNCIFFSITGEEAISKELLKELARLQKKYSVFFAVPFRPKIVDAINSDEREIDIEAYFNRYESMVFDYLDVVSNLESDKSVMGSIPVLPWGRTRSLTQNYLKQGISALCVNFNGRSPLVQPAQIDHILAPLQAEIEYHGWHRDGFLYAINADRGRRASAADFLSLATGFDAIGGYHTSPRGDEEFFKKLQEQDTSPFRIFRRSHYIYNDVPPSEVSGAFPDHTNLDADRAQQLSEDGNATGIRKVLRGEQMGLAANKLRNEINTGNAGQHIRSKIGVDGHVVNALDTIVDEFESDSRQEGLPGT